MYEYITLERDSMDNDYVLPDDYDVISQWAGDKFRISVRSAGKDTLKCLDRGAGAKPHSILDKTIKKKVLTDPEKQKKEKKYNDAVDAFFAGFPAADKALAEDLLMGLVGHLIKGKDHDTLDGIYLTQLGEKTFNGEKVCHPSTQAFSILKNKGMPYLVLNNEGEKEKLINFFKSLGGGQTADEAKNMRAYYLFTRLFFSGDYDTHDLIQRGAPVGTVIDTKVLKGLQDALIAGRTEQVKKFKPTSEELKEENAEDYCRVQHGPQYNYIAQMANENLEIVLKDIENPDPKGLEKLNVLVYNVMYTSFPVAACNANGKWVILKTDEDLKNFYETWGVFVKESWTNLDSLKQHIVHQIHTILKLSIPESYTKIRSDFKEFNEGLKDKKKYDEKIGGMETLLKAVPAFAAVYDDEKSRGDLKQYVMSALCELCQDKK